MHALHAAPRYFVRTALLALLLALAMVFAISELRGLQLPSIGEPSSTGSGLVTTQAPAGDAGAGSDAPAWVADPLRPPTFELER
jgi:hypothetical protein